VSDQNGDHERGNRYQRAGAATAGALLGGVIIGPVGVAIGAGLGVLLEPVAAKVWDELTVGGRRRAGEALAATCEALDCDQDELEARITASDRSLLMAGICISAATRTVWAPKVRALGRALASGLLAEDDATIDLEQLIMTAMADLEGPHLSMLELFAWRTPPRYAGDQQIAHPRHNEHGITVPRHGWTELEIRLYRSQLAPVAHSLLGTLQRHGLVAADDNTATALHKALEELRKQTARDHRWNANLAPPVANVNEFTLRSLTPPASWSATDLGERVVERYREAGADLPDGWVTTPAAADDGSAT
jgi:hypothetical protein